MYRWYMNAAVCYVYLSDVPGHCPPLSDEGSIHPSRLQWVESLEESRWFTRGWTLQELIAPQRVFFFGQAWNYIGSLPELVHLVSGITNIQIDVLEHSRPLSDLSIAQRLSWAAKRQTTRIEDQAYSLFGILDVNMPLLYGEGAKAFIRLQEEIIHHSTDQSIFAWDTPSGFIEPRELLLAPSPICFLNGSRIRRRPRTSSAPAFTISNQGLGITLPIVHQRLEEDPSHPYVTLGILDCRYKGSPNVLALVMKQHPFNIQSATPSVELYVSGYERNLGNNVAKYGRILPINPRVIDSAQAKLLTITRDLQSQTYIQAFNTNNPDWFPIRFIGDAQQRVPTLKGVYPEDCWYESSQTVRLRAPECSRGGILVHIQGNHHVLIAFGVYSVSSHEPQPSRRIYAISGIDPHCPIEPHLDCLDSRSIRYGRDAASLRLNSQQRLVAQLWNGALTVSVESSAEGNAPRSPSIHSLSPPSSPVATMRQPSFSVLPRRDSVLQDDRPERSIDSQDDISLRIHRTSLCENCRYIKANLEAERQREEDERRRKMEEEEASRRRAENQRNLRRNVRNVGMGLTVTSILADAAEFLV